MSLNDSNSDIDFNCFQQTNVQTNNTSFSTNEECSSSNSSTSTFSDTDDNDNLPDDNNIFEYVPTIIDAGVVISRAALISCL
jgi:hypothetical protein